VRGIPSRPLRRPAFVPSSSSASLSR
jgi:hypothetical protein